MKIIYIPYCYYPDPVGGTEVYVDGLAGNLRKLGVEVLIAAPGSESNETYFHNNLKVRRFAISSCVKDIADLYDEGDLVAAANFGKILDEERPEIAHFHALTPAVSLRLIREAKKRKIATIFTYHTPTVSCQKGTLMLGKSACDGLLDSRRCAHCILHGLGLSKGIAGIFGSMPAAVNNILKKINLHGGIFTAIRMRGLISERRAAFKAVMTEADHIIAVNKWVRDVLLRNDVDKDKISVITHGLAEGTESNSSCYIPISGSKQLRVAYLGRISPEKGIDILIGAFRLLPKVDMALHVYGLVQNKGGEGYLKGLKISTCRDSRIVFKDPIPNDQVISTLKEYNLLAVPSRGLETGPLVALEAFAAGVPVIGSDLGGIKELVKDGVNGLLIKDFSPRRWANTLLKIVKDEELLKRLKSGVKPPKQMVDVAAETQTIYNKIINADESKKNSIYSVH